MPVHGPTTSTQLDSDVGGQLAGERDEELVLADQGGPGVLGDRLDGGLVDQLGDDRAGSPLRRRSPVSMRRSQDDLLGEQAEQRELVADARRR